LRSNFFAINLGGGFSSLDAGHIAPFTNHDVIGLQLAEISENQRWEDSANFAVARHLTTVNGHGRGCFKFAGARISRSWSRSIAFNRGHDAVVVTEISENRPTRGVAIEIMIAIMDPHPRP
jgi:hypothetical protein